MEKTDREEILSAALKVFESRGLGASTMAEIAARAKIGRATLYRHFASKEDLLQALVLREARELFGRLEAAVGGEDRPEELFRKALPVALEFFQGHRLLQRVLRREPEHVIPYLTYQASGLMTAAVDFLEPYLSRAVKSSRLEVEPRVAGEWACRILLSLLTTESVVADLSDPAELESYLEPVLGAFAARSKRS